MQKIVLSERKRVIDDLQKQMLKMKHEGRTDSDVYANK